MPIAAALNDFKAKVAQCESLIANAHKQDQAGNPFFSALDRSQITAAAFLNIFIAWEAFLEASLAHLMTGAQTISGALPAKYVSPQDTDKAKLMVIGSNRFFDYSNHEYVKRIAKLYFDAGYPFEPHISAIESELSDLKTMRNATAHLSSTTQQALESLALRIFAQPKPGIDLYGLLTAVDPRSQTAETVLQVYQAKLVVTAELIAQG